MKFLFFAIYLILTLNLSAQLREFHITEHEQDGTSVVQASTEYPDNTMILVYSDLEGLDFRSSVGAMNQQRYNARANRYEILVSPQRQILFVAARGFIEQRIALINPEPKAVFYYQVEERKGQVETKVYFIVNPHDNDTQLFIDSIQEPIGQTIKVPVGNRNVVIKRKGYETLKSIVEIKEEEVAYEFNLKKIEPVSFKLKTNTSEALVRINSDIVGKTDKSGVFSWEAYPDKYDLELTKDGFIDYRDSLVVSNIDNEEYTINLVAKTGSLKITTTPSYAAITIRNMEGRVIEKLTDLKEFNDVKVGKYSIEISAQGYMTTKKEIVIKENQTNEVTVILKEPLSFQRLFVSKKYEPTSFLHLTYLPHLQEGQISLMNSNYGINYSFTIKQWGGYIEYGRSLNFESSSLEYSDGTVTGSQLFPEGLTGNFVPETNISSYEIGAGILYHFGIFTASLGVSYYDYQFRQFADFDSQEIEDNLMVDIPTNGFAGFIPKAGIRVLLQNFSIGYSVATYHPQSIGNMLMLGFAF